MCGASKQLKDSYANLANVGNALRGAFQTIFAGNQAILSRLEGSLAPSIAGGSSGYGFSAAEDAAKRGQATEEINKSNAESVNAVRGSMASMFGGNITLPSGSQDAINAMLAQGSAEKQAESQMAITQQGYETGRENYFKSVELAGALPGELENPATAAGGAALSGAEAQEKGANDITAANNAWMAPVAGMIGSLGGAAIGLAGPAKPACWVAAELYGGWFAPETCAIRNWLLATWWMRPFVAFYLRFGRAWAKLIQRRPRVRRATKLLFDGFLACAGGV